MPLSEGEILEQVIKADRGNLSREAANSFLALNFDRRTMNRIRGLIARNNRGSLTAEERITLDRYLRVGQLLDLLHAKARLSLNGSAASH
jgi:hypothetical protein